ncbi:hypothetical protein GCM10027589_15380 [Actinocorallia lasiicapitis]
MSARAGEWAPARSRADRAETARARNGILLRIGDNYRQAAAGRLGVRPLARSLRTRGVGDGAKVGEGARGRRR